MEKYREQIRKCFKISIYSLYILIIILTCYITINNFIIYNNEKTNNYILKIKLNSLNNKYNDFINTNNSINKRIDEIKNVDKNISDTKDNVFKLASLTEKKIKEGSTNYKIAYITFDDGPYFLTNSVLDILRNKKVKATFFTIGLGKENCYDNNNYNCTGTYYKEAIEGHVVANHTYSHAIKWGLYDSASEFLRQIDIQDNLIKDSTGIKPNIMRFPGGSAQAGGLKNEIINGLRERHYGWVDWTAQDGDGGNISSKEEAWNIFKSTINDNIEVILFHDYSYITYSLLGEAIDYLENNNYILLPLFYDSVMVNK